MGKVENATQYAIDIANDSTHGYDQTNRWGPNYDCSALVITAFQQAGIKVKSEGASYTGNMYSVFKKCGFKDVTKDINVKSGSGLKRGDVLLTPYNHTAIYIGNGKLVHASINEKGTVSGGKSGDQTGKEICVRSYYNHPWTYVLRYPETSTVTDKKVNVTYCARTQKHGWLPPVNNLDDYAGYQNSPITGIAIKVDKGSLKYRVHIKGAGWLGWVTGYNIKDTINGYAGNGKIIDAIQIYYYTPNDIRPYKRAHYKTNYGWQYDTETSGGQDGYAGVFGKNVTKLYIEIV